ncbi:MAG: DUF1776 domain-containing protein [Microbacterium hominis]|nr:DUF1776 domain-containing protein [Microbacterium hominis]
MRVLFAGKSLRLRAGERERVRSVGLPHLLLLTSRRSLCSSLPTPKGGTMSGSISDLIDEALTQAQAVWEAVVPADLGNLHDLPQHVAHSLDSLLDKLTNNGTLPVPNPRDWLPEQLQPAAPAPAPLPTPPAPLSSTALLSHLRAYLSRLASHSREHPWIYASVAVGLSGGASYYWAPHATLRTLEPLSNLLVPLAVLPDPKDRPHRLLPAQHRVAGEVRKEAVVVLGAESPHGREIALDLERRGFVVVATVADPADVDSLERTSRGWLKVLVLDPKEVSISILLKDFFPRKYQKS